MISGKEQQKEIETIRERTFKIRLSDADVERLALKAASGGLLPEELLQNFIGDLVRGTYSNGSDERMYAEQWFDRCWFSSYAPTSSLIQHLARMGCLEHAIELREKLRYSKEDVLDPELTEEEKREIVQDIREVEKELTELMGDYKMAEEWEKIEAWKDRLDCMLLEEM